MGFEVSLRALARGAVAIWLLALATPAQAQEMQPPPRHDSRSPTGVSYHNGSFSFEEEDLSIGGGMPAGLSLVRSYNSSTDSYSYPFMGLGWTSSLNIYIHANTLARYPIPEGVEQPPYIIERCIYNLVGGPRSSGFYNLTYGPVPVWPNTVSGCGGMIPGTYAPSGPSGDILEFIGAQGTGYFRLTGADGSVIKFHATSGAQQAEYWLMPDGTRLDFTYTSASGGNLKSVFSNRGWAILMESASKACAVNLAQTYVTPTSNCPADAQTVTYSYAAGTYAPGINVMTSMTKAGATRSYGYSSSNDHVTCIIDPGQTTCRIQNTYSACPHEPTRPLPQHWVRRNDPVVSQVDASGKAYQYTLSVDPCPWPSTYTEQLDYRPFEGRGAQVSESGIGGMVTSIAVTTPAGQLASFRDPLNRTTAFGYDAGTAYQSCCQIEEGQLNGSLFPEGNSIGYVRDARGNVTSQVVHPKPGSGLADQVTHLSFPSSCTNAFTCNKPTSVTDPRGNTTDYTYDPVHGGVLTEAGPADTNGVRPVTRYAYVQRTAWLKNSGGGYSAASPVWLLSTVKSCRTSPTVSGACAAGAGDEVVTTYEYGPNSGPNNLLLRGQAVTADGTTLRTCYGYDRDGRKISETQPNANLGSCP